MQLQHTSETLHQCCQVCGFPLELGYFNTVAVRWSGPNNVSPWNANYTTKVLHQKKKKMLPPGTGTQFFTGDPPWNAIGQVLSRNWVGFVTKTWQPCPPPSPAPPIYRCATGPRPNTLPCQSLQELSWQKYIYIYIVYIFPSTVLLPKKKKDFIIAVFNILHKVNI